MTRSIALSQAAFDNEHQRFLDESIRAFNSCQNEFRLDSQAAPPWLRIADSVNWPVAQAAFRESTHANDPCIIVTGRPLTDNWFSHCDGAFAVISTHEWFKLFAPPCLQAFLIHEFAIAVTCQTTGVNEMILRPHEAITGCIGDLCTWKPEIVVKLRAGFVCPEHRELLRQFGMTAVQMAALERVMNLVRAYALGRDEEKVLCGAHDGRRIFVVHGRDEAALRELESLLTRRFGLEAVAIIDEPAQGRTVIEQLEQYTQVGYAVILCTPDDDGRLAGAAEFRRRPRQNVVFEYGLLVGRLGRKRVCCVAQNHDIEIPSDLAGVLQLRYERRVEEIALRLMDELRAAGYTISA